MINTCKSILTLEQYYNSCPNISLLKGRPVSSADFGAVFHCSDYTSGSQKVNSLIYLKSFFENNGYIDYIKNPQKIIDDSGRQPQLKQSYIMNLELSKIFQDLKVNSLTYIKSFFENVEQPSLKQDDIIKLELPRVLQGLWLTNKDNPRGMDNSQLESFLTQAKKIDGYDIVIWTNIAPDKLKALNPRLEAANVIVRNIADIETQHTKLLDFVISPKEYTNLKGGNNSGLAIDVAKDIIMESQGGILIDLNFEFDDNFKQSDIEHYDFIAVADQFNFIENGIFVATPHNPIFIEILNIIDEMINSPDCSLRELREIFSLSGNPVDLFSMMPIAMAYMKYNNQEGNVDAVTPHRYRIYDGSHHIHLLNIEQTQRHEARAAQLNSSYIEDFEDYVSNYHQLICSARQSDHNYFIEVIGHDGKSNTWMTVDIG